MTKRKLKKPKRCPAVVKRSLKKQIKSLPKKIPKLILPRKLEISLVPFEEWTQEHQHGALYHGYNFVTKTADFNWVEYIRQSPSIYLQDCIEHEIKNQPTDTLLKQNGSIRENKIFLKIIQTSLKLVNSPYSSYYDYYDKAFIYLIPKEDSSIIKTAIELYNENYNDRITNLKAAFEQRKLEQVQSSSVPTKVPRSSKRKQSIHPKVAVKPKIRNGVVQINNNS